MAITQGSSIVTVQRLHNLRPGQSMICYRGDFDHDLSNRGTPQYSALLRRVHEAMRVERAGQITVCVDHEAIENPGKKKLTVFKRYTATGS